MQFYDLLQMGYYAVCIVFVFNVMMVPMWIELSEWLEGDISSTAQFHRPSITDEVWFNIKMSYRCKLIKYTRNKSIYINEI